jgi:hypothetical protein
VYAARELREHADWFYGTATGDAWKELLTDEELETVISIFEAAIARARVTTPEGRRRGGDSPGKAGLRAAEVTLGTPGERT